MFFKSESGEGCEPTTKTSCEEQGAIIGKDISFCGQSQYQADKQAAKNIDKKGAQEEIMEQRIERLGNQIAHYAAKSPT